MATKVSVGVTSATGYAATLVGLIGTVLALVLPDVPQEQSAMIASAVFAVGSFVVTQVGRYVQAREQIKQGAVVARDQALTESIKRAGPGQIVEYPTPKPASWQGSLKAPAGSTTTEPRPSATVSAVDIVKPEPGDPDALPDMLSTPNDAIEQDGDDRLVAAA